MKRKANSLNPRVFEEARKRVETAFPHQGVKKGFYIEDPKASGVFGDWLAKAGRVVANIVEDKVNLRMYRSPEGKAAAGVQYKVDERRGVNKEVIEIIDGSEVEDHHIKHNVPEDMMSQNNMTVRMIPDGVGGLKVDTDENGMVQTYVNFPSPTPESIWEILRKQQEEDNLQDKNRSV
jgi:hypothetical protein